MSSFLNALVGKFSSEQRKDLSEGLNVSWEEDGHVNFCRRCEREFGAMLRKHHCRGCGGIFCDDCTLNNILLPDIEDRVRACHGCCNRETPGDRVRQVCKIMEETIKEEYTSVSQIKLHRGTLYNDATEAYEREDGSRAHSTGYCEVMNKSDEVIAVRVFEETVNPFYESSRPSYMAVLPGETVHGIFDPTLSKMEVSILMSNPIPPELDTPIVFETQCNRPDDISPCASIPNFQEFCSYHITCSLKNCILKYKGNQLLEPRMGSASKLKKMLSLKKNSSTNLAILDFSTNIQMADVDRFFSSRSVKIV